jgi:hypothetical protein
MVQRLLALRVDVFEDYDEAHFLSAGEASAPLVRTTRLTGTGRLLVWFARDEAERTGEVFA